ncbi:MAG: GIY-YIG nuclease family protein [Planctomycetes bacterium]|nr:GIY-YIG nuclease family protein [Planctomycetota bacterium]MCK5578244.1 GIY-YIG nuclease family protein [Planctomycetota bacterium]
MNKWSVYICNKKDVLYTGITTDVKHRMKQHKAKLLCVESYDSKNEAAKREKQIKGWARKKKIELIKNKSLQVSLR